MSAGFTYRTNKGYSVQEIGVETDGVLYYVLLKRLDTREYSRMQRRELEAITLPKEAETVQAAPIAQKNLGIQLGIL